MAIKPRIPNSDKIELLANELADKPYGQTQDSLVRTTISLPASILFKLEDMARANRRKKDNLKSVSAIIRDYITRCLYAERNN